MKIDDFDVIKEYNDAIDEISKAVKEATYNFASVIGKSPTDKNLLVHLLTYKFIVDLALKNIQEQDAHAKLILEDKTISNVIKKMIGVDTVIIDVKSAKGVDEK